MPILAQAMPDSSPDGDLTRFLTPFIPWLPWLFVMAVFVWVMVRVQRKRQEQVGAHLERMRQHMDAVEQKLDRLIEQEKHRPRE